MLYAFPQTRHRQAKALAVFRYCPSGYLVAPVVEFFHKRVIAERMERVLTLDDLANHCKDLTRGCLFIISSYTLVEKNFNG